MKKARKKQTFLTYCLDEFFYKALPQILVLIIFLAIYFSEKHYPFVFSNIIMQFEIDTWWIHIWWIEIICWLLDIALFLFTFVLLVYSSMDLIDRFFKEDESYVSGSHIEISYDNSRDVFKADTVNEYSGNSHFLFNAIMWLFGLILIIGFGTIIFIVTVIRKRKQMKL